MTARLTQGAASWGIAALALVCVIGGLALAGGPGHARKERHDATRMDELRQLSVHIDCLVADSGASRPPAELGETRGCPGPVSLNDPYTGQPYRVELLGDRKYRLCTTFELAPDQTRPPRYGLPARRDGDCMIFTLRRPAQPGEFRPEDTPLSE